MPPFEQAMKELDALKEKKLWQQGLNKEYYTALTETLRRYIVDRFGVNAMEMTSGEILDILRGVKEAAPVYDKFHQILVHLMYAVIQLPKFVQAVVHFPVPCPKLPRNQPYQKNNHKKCRD